LADAARRRVRSGTRRQATTSPGRTRFSGSRDADRISSGRRGRGYYRQAAGVLVPAAVNWAADKALNHAVATDILRKWDEIERWRAQFPGDLIVIEVWIQEADVANEVGRARMLGEVNAYHGPDVADIERQIADAGRLSGAPTGWHLVGPFMGWIQPEQDLGKLRSAVEAETCFIATACCGSPDAPEVVVLRAYRDAVLAQHRPGRALMRAYYRASPPPARVIARHRRLRTAVRRTLVAPAAAAAARRLKRMPSWSALPRSGGR
jgi:hypothetical protein